jgi:hypothetical protein
MMRFVGRLLVLAAVVIGFAGCGDSGDLAEGMPQNTEYKPLVIPEAMKGKNISAGLTKKAAPVKGAPAPGAK